MNYLNKPRTAFHTTFTTLALTIIGTWSHLSVAADLDTLITQALNSGVRSAEEKARDTNRKPLETLSFFKLTPDMRVLELVPGGGWYTKVLAPALKDEGKLYLAIGTDRVAKDLLGKPGFEKVEVVEVDTDMAREGRSNNATYMKLGVKDLDMVLTFRNLHNFAAGGRDAINKAAFDALKPGGYYGVVDHTRRHNEPTNATNGRRMDPVLAIKEIQAAGFELVDFTDIHYKPSDKLELELADKAVAGKTDRFTLLFRKPE